MTCHEKANTMTKRWLTAILAVTSVCAGGTAATFAAEKAAVADKTAATSDGEGDAKAPAKTKKVRFKKSKQVDFSDQTVEGKLHRPEASLITASEGVTDNGLLRLREDFLDKFTTFAGEEIQQ